MVIVSVFSLVTLVVVGWLGINGMVIMKRSLNRTYNTDFVPMRLIAEANRAMIVLQREMLTHLLGKDVSEVSGYRSAVLVEKTILQGSLQQLSEINGLTEREIDLVRDLQKDLQETLPLSEDLIEKFKSGSRDEAIRVILTEIRPLLDSMDAKMNEFLEIQKVESSMTVDEANELYGRYVTLEVILYGVVVLAWFFVCLVIVRRLLEHHRFI